MSRSLLRAVWAVLAIVAISDALLAPFYPQLMQGAFGSTSPLAVGGYVAVCRAAIVIGLPCWAKLSQRLGIVRTVTIAQLGAIAAGSACAFAPSFSSFLVLSFLSEACRAAYLLLFPLLVSLSADLQGRGTTAVRINALMCAAALVAALIGATLIDCLGPRAAILGVVFVDVAARFILGRLPPRAEQEQRQIDHNETEELGEGVGFKKLALIAITSSFAVALLRPHFSAYVEERAPGSSLFLIGFVFVIPSVVAITMVPFLRPSFWARRSRSVLFVALAGLGVMSAAQLAAQSLGTLALARAAYGASAFVMDASLDTLTLASKDALKRFSLVNALQNVAITVAPLTAGTLLKASGWPALFLLATGAALLGAAALANIPMRRPPRAVEQCG